MKVLERAGSKRDTLLGLDAPPAPAGVPDSCSAKMGLSMRDPQVLIQV